MNKYFIFINKLIMIFYLIMIEIIIFLNEI